MKLKTNKILIMLFSLLTILLIFSLKVNAANANITVEPSKAEVGQSVKITVSGKGVQWNLKLKVDGEVLKTDSELENYESNKNISFSVTYTPKTAGTKKVTLEGSVTEYSDGSTIKSFESKSISVSEKKQQSTTDKKEDENKTPTIDKTPITDKKEETTTPEKPKEKSKDADLLTLGVTPKKYDFTGFKKSKTSYSVTVPNDVDSLKVIYKKSDSNAKVKVIGNSGFDVGSDNEIKIVVTAEAGNTKTYTIKVTKLAEEEEKPGNLIEEDTELCLTSLSIEGVELSSEFKKDIYSYTASLLDSEVTELKVEAVANNEKAKIDISGNTKLVEGENTINIVLTLENTTQQTVYQIVVIKEVSDELMSISDNLPRETNNIMGTIKTYIGIVVGIVIFIIVAIIILVILLKRENIKENEENEESTKTEEYNVYKNDENEFANNDIKKDNFIETLYKQRNGEFKSEDLNEQEKETLEEISKQTAEIFKEKQVEGKAVEKFFNEFKEDDDSLEVKRKRRSHSKGKHSK